MLPVVGAYGGAIIAERNFGGAMVAETLRHADPNIPIREVVASRGKMVRGRLALLSRAFGFIST
jgi:phage terminase large subunit-like protein